MRCNLQSTTAESDTRLDNIFVIGGGSIYNEAVTLEVTPTLVPLP